MLKIKKSHLSSDYIWFYTISILLCLKLAFSYLIVEHSYWIRHLPNNFEHYNIFGAPKNLTKNVEYLIIPLIFGYIVANFKYLGRLKTTFLLSLSLFMVNLFTFVLTPSTFLESLELSLKLLSPLYLFLALIIFRTKRHVDLRKLVVKVLVFCIILIIIGLLFLEISVNRKIEQWPIFFGNIHTHSYIVATIFIAFGYNLMQKKEPILLIIYFIVSFFILFVGYAVRTPLLLYLVFIIIALYTKSNFFKLLWVKLLVFLPLLILAFFLLLDIDIDNISSGRITMYGDKFEMLSGYSVIEFLFGRGYGSDLIVTEKWWYDEKGSHSDYITYVIENGILYFMLFLLLIVSIIPNFRRLNLIFFSLIVGYLITSLISNGIAVRPLAGYVFFTVLAYVYSNKYLQPKEAE